MKRGIPSEWLEKKKIDSRSVLATADDNKLKIAFHVQAVAVLFLTTLCQHQQRK